MARISNELRRQVFERDHYTCRYCSSQDGPFHADHVYPASKGGETTLENLVTACAHCNIKKSNKVGLWPNPLRIRTRTSRPSPRLMPNYVPILLLVGVQFIVFSSLSKVLHFSPAWIGLPGMLIIVFGILFLR